MLFTPQFPSYEDELMFFISRIFEFFSYSRRMNFFFLVFSILIILVQIRIIYYMLHITSYHHYPLVEIHLCQGYLNNTCSYVIVMLMIYKYVLFN